MMIAVNFLIKEEGKELKEEVQEEEKNIMMIEIIIKVNMKIIQKNPNQIVRVKKMKIKMIEVIIKMNVQ